MTKNGTIFTLILGALCFYATWAHGKANHKRQPIQADSIIFALLLIALAFALPYIVGIHPTNLASAWNVLAGEP